MEKRKKSLSEHQKLSPSAEDYLEAARMCTLRGERIKVTTLSAQLGVSKPAVTAALGELVEKGLIAREKYGDITLTERGKQKAEEVFGKHRLMHDLLVKLGVSEAQASVDCCKIEHVLSEESIACIRKFVRGEN